MPKTIVSVLLPVPLAQVFDYRLPEGMPMIDIGQRVQVEFGKSRTLTGIATDIRDASAEDLNNPQLKTILKTLEPYPIVDEKWLQCIRFASRYYAEPLGKALANALPHRLRHEAALMPPRISTYTLTPAGRQTRQTLPKRLKKQRRLLDFFDAAGKNQHLDQAMLRQAGFSKSDWHKACEAGYIKAFEQSPYRDEAAIKKPPYALNAAQRQALTDIRQQQHTFAAYLLYGVTGSGKTEIYMQLIADMMAIGKQALLLVPEIALTPQMLARFKQRFGRRVAAYHSALGDNARRDIFVAASQNELPIAIGTRSAIFVPMPNLGLILVDEEHDISYKQQQGFLYNARDLAIYRAKQLDINVVLGSASPSLESLHNINRKKFTLLQLGHRATNASLPKLQVVDQRGQPRTQVLAKGIISRMRQVLDRGEQVLLFLNRRGFANAMMCADCGWVSQCPCCSVYQTAHLSRRQLNCHHCGHVDPIPLTCPNCHSNNLFFLGAGTEKIESQLQQQFPKHRILRIDRDKQTTARQLDGAFEKIYRHEADIIVGTQLITKGHHFPKVTMVCIVDADQALFSSDFRAEERLFQQLLQVAGRAGRESHSGEVYIQSHVPAHDFFKALLKQDYLHYANALLQERQVYQLPPYRASLVIKASSLKEKEVIGYLRNIKTSLQQHDEIAELITILGPMPLAVRKAADRFQAKLCLNTGDRRNLQKILPILQSVIAHVDSYRRFKTIIDVDSLSD